MDKQQRRDLKKQYKAERQKSDPGYQFISKINQRIDHADRIKVELFSEWDDEQVEENIVDYVFNRFKKEGKKPRDMHAAEWERGILRKLPPGVVAVYATHLFELCLNVGGGWDFFYQASGAIAMEALDGYKLMNDTKMTSVMEECIGAYLKLRNSGAVEEACGEPHQWDFDEQYFIGSNTKTFDQLDKEYRAEGRDFIGKSFA
ncbi:MAG: DUF4375 domain-containing protein [Chryseolinea sp.]